MQTFPSLYASMAVGGLAALVSWAAMPVIRRWALSKGALVHAREDRWHTGATPAFGGLGIFLAIVVALAAGSLVAPSGAGWSWLEALASPRAAGLLGAATLMFLLGLADDLRDLNPATKLAVQLLAASVLVSSGYLVVATGVAVIDVVVSLGWFVAITNAVNLLDNMNGLAGGVAAIAAVYLGIMVTWEGLWLHALVAFALAGACLGFLIHNYPRAGIFMGDSGSLLIGVSLAALSLAPTPSSSGGQLVTMAVPLLVLAVPILDTVLVTVSRLAEGRPLSQGGRDHASHRLVAAGMLERRAVRLLWLFGALSGAVALALRTSQRSFAVLLGGVVLLGLATVAFHLLGVHVRERVGGRTLLARVLVSNRHWPALTIGLDVIALAAAYYGAYLLRWDGADLTRELAYFRQTLAMVITVKVVAFAIFKVYGSPLRHLSVEEAERIAVANLTGSGAAFLGAIMVFDYGFSRGILVADFVLGLLLTLGYRLSIRILDRQGSPWHDDAMRVAIVGSEQDALLVLGELRAGGIRAMKPVSVLDPAGYEGGGHLRGLPVRSGARFCHGWLDRNSVGGLFAVRRDGCLEPPVSELVERCLEEGVPVHFLDVALRLNGGPRALSVGRPESAPRPVVHEARGAV